LVGVGLSLVTGGGGGGGGTTLLLLLLLLLAGGCGWVFIVVVVVSGGGLTTFEVRVVGGAWVVVSVTGQTVVLTAMVTVVRTVLWAGHFVSTGGQLVMVWTDVV
jgi:hypothetical protein